MLLESLIKLKQEFTQALVGGYREKSAKLAHTLKEFAIEMGGEKLAAILSANEQAVQMKNYHVSPKVRDAFKLIIKH